MKIISKNLKKSKIKTTKIQFFLIKSQKILERQKNLNNIQKVINNHKKSKKHQQMSKNLESQKIIKKSLI